MMIQRIYILIILINLSISDGNNLEFYKIKSSFGILKDSQGVNNKNTHTYPNGDQYIGDWEGSVKHGYGNYTWHDGDQYIGDWEGDVRNGLGLYAWINGDKYVGEFLNTREGWGVYSSKNGNLEAGIWFNDKIVKSKNFIEVISYLKIKYPNSDILKNY